MCSIDEAWAGQDFGGKPVTSQGDLHKAYMSLPDDIMSRNNKFTINNPNEPQPRDLTRGINSKYSREPRVPSTVRNSSNANINISSQMPPLNNYGGLNPRPAYMEIYDKSDPMPVMVGEQFTDIDSAFNVSNSVSNFMNRGISKENMNTTHNTLLDEDTEDDRIMFNTKYTNKQNENNKNEFTNVRVSNKYNSSDNDSNSDRNNDSNISNQDNTQVLLILQQVLSKLDNLERTLHHQQSRNMYDIVLYILIGMLLAFIIFSIYSSMKRK
jgi:hypothetical protein